MPLLLDWDRCSQMCIRDSIDTMQKAGNLAAEQKIELVIEPLNLLVDHPGYHLSTSREAFDILEKIDSDNVKILLFDIYHQQITEGNLHSNIFDHLNQIGHFHAAAVPGRGPITGGEINYTYLISPPVIGPRPGTRCV